MAKQRKTRTLPANYMDVVFRPGEIAFHETETGLVVLDRENTGFFNRLAQRFFHRPPVSHIQMDRFGTALWKRLDGERSVFAVIEEMKTAFPEEERMLDRCVQFLRILEVNRFIVRKKAE